MIWKSINRRRSSHRKYKLFLHKGTTSHRRYIVDIVGAARCTRNKGITITKKATTVRTEFRPATGDLGRPWARVTNGVGTTTNGRTSMTIGGAARRDPCHEAHERQALPDCSHGRWCQRSKPTLQGEGWGGVFVPGHVLDGAWDISGNSGLVSEGRINKDTPPLTTPGHTSKSSAMDISSHIFQIVIHGHTPRHFRPEARPARYDSRP